VRIKGNAGWGDSRKSAFLVVEPVDVPEHWLAQLGQPLLFDDAAAKFAAPLRRILNADRLFLRG
jgi:hypothetical protein